MNDVILDRNKLVKLLHIYAEKDEIFYYTGITSIESTGSVGQRNSMVDAVNRNIAKQLLDFPFITTIGIEGGNSAQHGYWKRCRGKIDINKYIDYINKDSK